MAKEIINPSGVAAPTGYSHAVKKTGTPVHIAGQVARDAQGNTVGVNDAGAQAEQVYQNLQKVVEACGGTMSDIVKLTVYTTDLSYRPAIGAVRQRYFPDGQFPASTFVVITSLAEPQYLVEIEAVAMID